MADMIMIPVSKISQHPDNPRKNLGNLQELADSIRENGIFQNLTVVPRYGEDTGEFLGDYTVIIGHRRLAAAKLAGLTAVPCVVMEMTQREQLSTMLLENMQRSDLTPMEEAEGFQLMLDMGDTVAGIASQTGISETTVRRRLNIAKLDKKAYQKGIQRGATLQDYLRLEKIQSMEKRNEVLKSIGTQNFEIELRRAVEAEKNEAYMKQITDQFRAADWCREIQREADIYKKYDYVKNYGTYKKNPVEVPEDAGKVKYYFAVGKNQVDLYREKSTDALQKSEKELLLDGMKKHMQEIISKLQWEWDIMLDMRRDFVTHFSRVERYREEIISMSTQAMLEWIPHPCKRYHRPISMDIEGLGQILDVEYDPEAGTLQRENLSAVIRSSPEKILLMTAYFAWEAGVEKSWKTDWNSKLQCQVPKYCDSKVLRKLYDILRDMEYDISDEEQDMLDGKTSWFAEAADLEKEMEALHHGTE